MQAKVIPNQICARLLAAIRPFGDPFWSCSRALGIATICLGLLGGPGANAEPKPWRASLFWQVFANPDISSPDKLTTFGDQFSGKLTQLVDAGPARQNLRFYSLPLDKKHFELVGPLPEGVRQFIFQDGTLRFPVQPDDFHIARSVFKGQVELSAPIITERSASRSAWVYGGNAQEDYILSFKASTNTVFGGNPDKVFGRPLAQNHLAANQLIQDTSFEWAQPIREPLFLFYKDIAVAVRDWSPFIGPGKTNYYMPYFSTLHDVYGSLLGLLNGYQDAGEFFNQKVIYPLGRAQGEWAEKTALELTTPHFQNFYLEMDAQFRVTGRVLFPDFGDANLSATQAERIYTKQQIQAAASLGVAAFDRPYKFRVPYRLDSNISGGFIARNTNDGVGFFVRGVYDYFRQHPSRMGDVAIFESGGQGGSSHFDLVEAPAPQGVRGLPPSEDPPPNSGVDLMRLEADPIYGPTWRTLSKMLGKAIAGREMSARDKAGMETMYLKMRAKLLSDPGPEADLVRSALVFLGLKKKELLLKQAQTTANAIERAIAIELLLPKFFSSPEVQVGILKSLERINSFSQIRHRDVSLAQRIGPLLMRGPPLTNSTSLRVLLKLVAHDFFMEERGAMIRHAFSGDWPKTPELAADVEGYLQRPPRYGFTDALKKLKSEMEGGGGTTTCANILSTKRRPIKSAR